MRPVRWVLPLLAGLLLLTGWSAATSGEDAGARASVVVPATAEPGGSPLADELAGVPKQRPTELPSTEAARTQIVTASAGPPLPPMARYDELVLLAPSDDPVLIGFHEAYHRDRLELEPVGQLDENLNATRTVAPSDDPEGSPYLILHSRGRAAPATSAIDVVLRDDDPVIAPVDGVVTDVRDTLQSGQYPDVRLEITPDVDPDLRVVVIHVDEVEVEVGDRVVGGVSPLAGTARRFPFFSQIDAHTEPERWPHVHLEVMRAAEEAAPEEQEG